MCMRTVSHLYVSRGKGESERKKSPRVRRRCKSTPSSRYQKLLGFPFLFSSPRHIPELVSMAAASVRVSKGENSLQAKMSKVVVWAHILPCTTSCTVSPYLLSDVALSTSSKFSPDFFPSPPLFSPPPSHLSLYKTLILHIKRSLSISWVCPIKHLDLRARQRGREKRKGSER